MFANMNTAFYERGSLNLNRKDIIKNYVKNSLITDILA